MSEPTQETEAAASQSVAKTAEQLKEEVRQEIYKQLATEGCTAEMLDGWRAQFGPLGFVPIGDKLYVTRPLLRKEWKEMNKVWQARSGGENPVTEFDTEEEIAAKATLWPQLSVMDLRGLPAGVATSLASAISSHAGFVPNASPIVL